MDVEQLLEDPGIIALLTLAIEEDIGAGDRTTQALIDPNRKTVAQVVARESLVACGLPILKAIFHRIDSSLEVDEKVEEGSRSEPGQVLATIKGSCASILTAERVALNVLQHLSGIATVTSRIARIVSESGVTLLDTRKTTPGWRLLEKYAVFVGGGTNHRLGLYDAILIKNNHIDILDGDVEQAIKLARSKSPKEIRVEVEVRNQHELDQALKGQPDAILFDNYTPESLRDAVRYVRENFVDSHAQLEASGGINEGNVAAFSTTGVDAVSMGSLTHSARSVDISLCIEEQHPL